MMTKRSNATGHITRLLLITVLALDIGGAGTVLALGAAEAQGHYIHLMVGP
jgi:hypothetical protein